MQKPSKNLAESVFFLSLLLLLISPGFAQQASFNFNFEKQERGSQLPQDWFTWGDYQVSTDTQIVSTGNYAARISSNGSTGSFGSIAYKIPADYQGKSISLKGFMKLKDVKGFAGLMLRIDGDAGSLAFDNMSNQGLAGTEDWKEYQITLDYPENARSIYIAGILSGGGTAWFDDFQVFMDGKNLQFIEKVERPLAKAALDKEFDAGSGFYLEDANDAEINRLYRLGKIWGFLKYYHPAVAAGEINWDYELFRMLPAVKSANFDDILKQWIHSLDTISENTSGAPPQPENLKSQPSLDWISDTSLFSSSIGNRLAWLKDSVYNENHYYISLKPSVGNPVFTNENSYPEMDWNDTGYKLLALFRYWNMIEYYFPYKHLIEKDWDKVLQEYIPQMAISHGELEYKLTLLRLIGEVHDTHANIWQLDSTLETFYGQRTAPVQVEFIENFPVVVKIDDSFLPKSNIEVGDIITAVNGKEVNVLIKERLQYCPASNYPTKLRDLSKKLLRTNDSTLTLTLKSSAGSKKENIPTAPISSFRYRRKEQASHDTLAGDIGYIYPGSLKDGEIDSIMQNFMEKKAIIIDFRCYPSDFIVFKLGKYLMPQPTEFVKFSVPSIAVPGTFTWRGPLRVGETNEAYYRGKLVVLINEKTQSSAEYHCMALRQAPDVTLIGSTTAGADGNVSEIMLPGNIRSMISGIGVYYPDGGETQRIGIVPDIEIRPGIDGIRRGEDEVLQKALSLIRSPE